MGQLLALFFWAEVGSCFLPVLVHEPFKELDRGDTFFSIQSSSSFP
jgi:hypothetical protein